MKPKRTAFQLSTYAPLLADLKVSVRAAQVKAAVAVNPELILSYWHIGRENLQAQKARARALKADISRVLGTYRAEPNVAPLVRQAPWSHYLLVLSKCKRAEGRVK